MENIFIDLIITIFIYLIFPVIYRLGHGKVPKTQGKIIALMNSIFCSIIFIIIRLVILGGEFAVVSFAPAVLYYFIAKSILVDNDLSEKEYEERLAGNGKKGSMPGRCPECNNKVSDGDEECYVCGYILKPKKEETEEESKDNW